MGKKKRRRRTQGGFTVYEMEHECPICGAKMECLSSVLEKDTKPTPGTFTLCVNCGDLGILDEKNLPRRPEPMETFELMMSPLWKKVQLAQALIRRGPRFGKYPS